MLCTVHVPCPRLVVKMKIIVYLQVIDHYENPRNVGSLDKNDRSVGTGLVGAPACGDVMKLQVGCMYVHDMYVCGYETVGDYIIAAYITSYAECSVSQLGLFSMSIASFIVAYCLCECNFMFPCTVIDQSGRQW